jgi:hypothetical protein
MKKHRLTDAPHQILDDEKLKEKTADWIIEKVGELGITDDIITKRHMLDAYCDEDDHHEEILRG